MANLDFRRRVTDTVIQVVERHGGLPRGGPEGFLRPFNVASGTYYHGGNAVNLLAVAQLRGVLDPRWMTQRQAEEAGYRVRPGALASYVEYWDFARAGQGGERAQPRYAVVFNGADVIDLAPFVSAPPFTAGRRAALFSTFGQRSENGSLHALVSAAITQWRERAPAEAAAFGRGVDRESLRAELTAVFLATSLHFPARGGTQSPALPLDVLQHDKHELFRAAREAEVVFDYLVSAVPTMSAEYEARPKAHKVARRPSSSLDRLASLPIFPVTPPSPKPKVLLDPDAPAAIPEAERWEHFRGALRARSDGDGLTGLDAVLSSVQPAFGALMSAAQQNGIPDRSVYEALGTSIVARLKALNEQNQRWGCFAQDVDRAAGSNFIAEAQRALTVVKKEFMDTMHNAVRGQWDEARASEAINRVLFGADGPRAIDHAFVVGLVERTGVQPSIPVQIPHDEPEADFVLTPLGSDEPGREGPREWDPEPLIEHAQRLASKAPWDADSAITRIVQELEAGNPDTALAYTSLPGVREGEQPAQLLELRNLIEVTWAQWRADNGLGQSITPTGKRSFEAIPRNLMALTEPKTTLAQANTAMKDLGPFLSRRQAMTVKHLMRGEERQFFFDKMVELKGIVHAMPRTYGGGGDVQLHYFLNGSDWYIAELDSDGTGAEQAFGYAVLNGDIENSELGYISIEEIVGAGAELDFHWRTRSLDHVQAEVKGFKRLEARLASIDWSSLPGAEGGRVPELGTDLYDEVSRLAQLNRKTVADLWRLHVPARFACPTVLENDEPAATLASQRPQAIPLADSALNP